MRKQNLAKDKSMVTAIILTGGEGARCADFKIPKQFVKIYGKPIFVYCLELYEQIKEVTEICLVINKRFETLYNKIIPKTNIKKLKYIVGGGKYRHESIKNALDRISHNGLVVIHNGVNPTTPKELIRKCIRVAKKSGGATAFTPACHTIFTKNGLNIDRILKRTTLNYARDPQVYSSRKIKRAFSLVKNCKNRDIATLELMNKYGYLVTPVESTPNNIKLTTEHNLKSIESILKKGY